MIRFRHRGNFRHTENFFSKVKKSSMMGILKKYGEAGVQALASVTPTDSGKTASSWSYDIEQTDGGYAIHWDNTNINNGVNIALILQYGHGTGTGGYVTGVDYINPALRPIFEQIADEAMREVS